MKESLTFSLIAAVANNGVIGLNNKLPWSLPADMKHFRKTTWGEVVVMGHRTHDSIHATLQGRLNVVLSSNPDCPLAKGTSRCQSIEQAIHFVDMHGCYKKIFFIGGSSVYRATLPFVDEMYLTWIHADFEGDTYFPDVEWDAWQEQSRREYQPNSLNSYPYTFSHYVRL